MQQCYLNYLHTYEKKTKRTFIREFHQSNHFVMKTVENAAEKLFGIFLLSVLHQRPHHLSYYTPSNPTMCDCYLITTDATKYSTDRMHFETDMMAVGLKLKFQSQSTMLVYIKPG